MKGERCLTNNYESLSYNKYIHIGFVILYRNADT
jgi:hypothetical protein